MKTGAGTQKDFDAAQSALREAQARVNTSQTRLARRSVAAPVTGSDRAGLFPAGRDGDGEPKPIVSILPPGNMKVRFFVPEAMLPHISYGETVAVRCDGSAAAISSAKVSFISKTAEFTPPVIYSNEERAKLKFS